MNMLGLAKDAFIAAIPDDVYDLCPCGCGKKFKFVANNSQSFKEHESNFCERWIKSHSQSFENKSENIETMT